MREILLSYQAASDYLKLASDFIFTATLLLSCFLQLECMVYLKAVSYLFYSATAFCDFCSFCVSCRKSLEEKHIKDYASLSLIS